MQDDKAGLVVQNKPGASQRVVLLRFSQYCTCGLLHAVGNGELNVADLCLQPFTALLAEQSHGCLQLQHLCLVMLRLAHQALLHCLSQGLQEAAL